MRRAIPLLAALLLQACGPKEEARHPVSAAQQTIVDGIAHAGGSDIVANARPDGGMSVAGNLDGRPFGIAIPANWNHQAVLFANGYSIPGTPVKVPADPIAHEPSGGFLTAAYNQGYAVGQSGFDKSAMAVKSGVANTLRLRRMFADIGTSRFFLGGASMGGNIVMALIETHPDQFVGAMTACGVTAGWEQEVGRLIDLRVVYDYFTAGTAYALPGGKDPSHNALSPVPPFASEALRAPWLFMQIKRMATPIAALFKAARANPDGPEARIVARIASVAGVDPDPAVFIFPIMTAMVGMDDLRASFGGNAFGNDTRVYHSALLSEAENAAMNRAIPRFRADPAATAFANRWYRSTGRFQIPLVTIHNPQDGLVFSEQAVILAERVKAAGNDSHFRLLWAPSVQRDIPSTGLTGWAHCGFTPRQATMLWTMLHGWVESGQQPPPGVY